MKVCLLGPVHPYRGGIAHFTTMLARAFSAQGHEVGVVSYSRLYPSLLFPGRTQFDTSESALRIDSDRIVDSIAPWTWPRAGTAIAQTNPDAVVVQWWHPFFAPALRSICGVIRKRTDARIVFLCHNVLPHEASLLDRTLVQIAFPQAHAFLVQSSEDGRRLEQLRPGALQRANPHPIYDEFDAGRFDSVSARQKLGVGGRVLLFFGFVRRYKGVDTLLEAFARCAKELDLTLLVVGEFYEDRRPYDDLINRLGIADRVRVVDRYVPNDDIEMYFKAADLVVLPYRSATQSGIVQTAYSFRKPVVVTRVGGLPDVVSDGGTGFVVPPEDPAALAGAIRRFFSGPHAETMPARIEEELDRFSWRHCVDTLLSLVESATAGP